MSVDVAARHAVNTLMSGPAAGVKAAAYTALAAGYRNVISCDMGGTSFDVGVIRDGSPRGERRQGNGLRPACPRADDRHPHDRRGRRLDRAGELGRHPAGRARRARAPTRDRSATGAAATSPPSPTRTRCWAGSIPAALLGVEGARRARSHPRDLRHEDRGALGLGAEEVAARHHPRRQRQDGGRHPPRLAQARPRSARLRPLRLRRRRPAPRGGARARARDPTVLVPARPGNHLGARLPRGRRPARLREDHEPATVRRLDIAEARAHPGRAGGRGPRLLATEGVEVETVTRLHEADMQFAGQTHVLTVRIPAHGLRARGSCAALSSAPTGSASRWS